MAGIIAAGVMGIIGLVAQNQQNKAAIANNDQQQQEALANAKAAREWAQQQMAPWLAPGAGPAASMSPGAAPGPLSLNMAGPATQPVVPGQSNPQKGVLPGQRSPQDMARAVMAAPPAAPAPVAPTAPQAPVAPPPRPVMGAQLGAPGPGPRATGPQQPGGAQGMSPAQAAVIDRIFPRTAR